MLVILVVVVVLVVLVVLVLDLAIIIVVVVVVVVVVVINGAGGKGVAMEVARIDNGGDGKLRFQKMNLRIVGFIVIRLKFFGFRAPGFVIPPFPIQTKPNKYQTQNPATKKKPKL